LFTFPQVCLFDLDYGLPVQVRDTALGIEKEDVPQSDVGKEFQLNEQIKKGETDSSYSGSRPNDILLQLQRTGPYYKVRAGVWVCQQQQQDHGSVGAA
jgi:pre-mRNA-splicing factor RBM22/SLT11